MDLAIPLTSLAQFTPDIAQQWDKVGIVGFLICGSTIIGISFLRGWVVSGSQYKAKVEECDQERSRADKAEERYIEVLKSDIEERKQRDQTLDLLSKVAAFGKEA